MAGRKPKPAHLKILTGNPGRRPIPNEPIVVEPLGDPPADWQPPAKRLWWELQSQVPPGVARKSDRILFELLCRMLGRVRERNAVLSPSMAAQIRVALGCLGMTPADRARLTANAPIPEESEVSRLYFKED